MTASSHGVEIKHDGVKQGNKLEVWYYVETAITRQAETIIEQTTFRAHLERATRPKDAERRAIADAQQANRGAEVRHFMTRRLTDEKAAKIRAQFDAGTWEGWRF